MKKYFGFTLAEVLITLGIIGVVAAMTIPTLISNTNSAKFRSQFKKTLSTVNQAALMSVAQYDFDYAATNNECDDNSATDNANELKSFCAIYNGTLSGAKYIKSLGGELKSAKGAYSVTSKSDLLSGGSADGAAVNIVNYYGYLLADGSLIAFPQSAAACAVPLGSTVAGVYTNNQVFSENCIGFIDVNGATLPNTEVSCGEGQATGLIGSACTVPNDAAHMTDVFPVAFHDSTVEPISNAAQYILTTAK